MIHGMQSTEPSKRPSFGWVLDKFAEIDELSETQQKALQQMQHRRKLTKLAEKAELADNEESDWNLGSSSTVAKEETTTNVNEDVCYPLFRFP